MSEQSVFELVGEDGFRDLVAAFYRQIPDDEILGPMYPANDLAGAEERLRDFLVFRFGGPQQYLEKRGHPKLRMRHAPFVVNQAARDRWIQLMWNAIDETKLRPEAVNIMKPFLEQVATFLMNSD